MRSKLRFDYATVGHVTVDLLEDGSRRPGGTAFYSALQAARLGLRALVLTRGRPSEIEELLAPYAGELTLRVEPAPRTTTLQTSGAGGARRQRLLSWAGLLAPAGDQVQASIVHLAPVAAELEAADFRADFVGLTAQGLLRRWQGDGGEITLISAPPVAQAIAARSDAVVVDQRERARAQPLIDVARAAGATVVVTAGPEPNTLLLPDGGSLQQAVPPVPCARDDLGAGDVFAAALFVQLAAGVPPQRATELANAAAAVRMSGEGAGAVGDRRAIEARAAATAGAA